MFVMGGGRAPSDYLRENVKDFRNRHKWTQTDLADRLTELRVPWSKTTVAKVERIVTEDDDPTLTRGVSIDEAISLAFVLGVPLSALVLPLDGREMVALTPSTVAPAATVRAWERGQHSFDASPDGLRLYNHESRGDDEVTAEQNHPGVTLLASYAFGAMRCASDDLDDVDEATRLRNLVGVLTQLRDETTRVLDRARKQLKNLED
jgi:transcriptional regulator with XRE-family HTH domain